MSVASIEVQHLTKRFGSFTALDDLNLKIEGAKCVGFLGPNGAGKTTTLKMVTDMIFPTGGQVLINGESVRGSRKRALAYCGVLIESPEIYPSLTPREALEMVADIRGVPRAEWQGRIDTVLAEVKMMDWADHKVGRFSKGMKQRINIACTLVHDPQILILDEPATGLDPRGMAEVRSIVRELKKRDRLVFMSSHILAEVTDVCDEVALIDHGKLRFYDTLPNIVSRFSAAQSTIDLAFARPLTPEQIKGQVEPLAGVAGVEVLDPRRLRVKFTGGLPVQESILKSLAAAGIGLVSLQESNSALEEIYLSQIEKGD